MPSSFNGLVESLLPKPQPVVQPTLGPGIPLASMVDRLNPNALALQQQYSTVPWYAAPGMFKGGPIGHNQLPPQPAVPAVPPAAPVGQTPEEVLRLLFNQNAGGGANSEGDGSGGGGGVDFS